MMSLANTPWLSDWRKFADESDLNPKARRAVDQAIRKTSEEWEGKHAEVYRDRADHRFSTRDEKVVGACDEMSSRLAEIRRELRAGRLNPQAARTQVRNMRAAYDRARDLHDTLIGQEDELRAFAEMTPDDYQQQFADKFPVYRQTAPSLAGVVAQMTDIPSGGGSLAPRSGYEPTDSAPSPDDLIDPS